VLQFHDKPDPPFPELRRWNQWYAARHGYDYKLHDGRFEDGEAICPYFGKVKAVLENLSRFSYVLMLDTDAVVRTWASLCISQGHCLCRQVCIVCLAVTHILSLQVHDMERPVESLLQDEKQFLYSGDSPALSWDSPFCAGEPLSRECSGDGWLARCNIAQLHHISNL
jgi:hypothetical protein